MTAALLRNELFHQLLASKPERTGADNARAGAFALAVHAAIILLILQIPATRQPGTTETITTPIVLDNITYAEYTEAPFGGVSEGGSDGPPAILPPDIWPEIQLPAPPPAYRIGDEFRPINMDPPAKAQGGGGGSRQQGQAGGDENFVVLQSAPHMVNADKVSALLRRAYPSRLMQAGIGGTVVLHVLINSGGEVIDARVAQSSGITALDEAALEVSREMLFTPAQNRYEAVRVWAEIPVMFSARD